ncbi:uncharacterized protein LOC142625223 [Castanea sativa]|uniref:uncharacterized protein LOC142625223 n=1 Tax=Castanea sativa TaxID=21020 RepID=UPI003F65004B
MESDKKFLKSETSCVVEDKGNAGGLCIMWKNGMNLKVVEFNKNLIAVKVSNQCFEWMLVGFYGPPYHSKKKKAWGNLFALLESRQGPWAVMGDFNFIVNEEDQLGGNKGGLSSTNYLKELLFEFNVVDLGYSGNKYTWAKGKWGKASIKMRLDKGVASISWRLAYPRATIMHIGDIKSDHALILMDTNPSGSFTHRPFRFEAVWFRDERCSAVIEEVWKGKVSSSEFIKLYKKQCATKDALRKWNKELDHLVLPCITEEENERFKCIPTLEEIKDVLFQMQDFKAPSPDEFPALFYKQLWPTVGNDVIKAVTSFVTVGSMPKEEILHSFKTCKTKPDLMEIKLDLQKAYDKVNWKFLTAVLLHFRFNETFTRWIIACQSSVSFEVVVNEGKSECFKPGRGLRQGDHLSSYLFILGQEVLSKLIEHELRLKNVAGIKTSISGLTISHVMYADDVVLFTKASRKDAESLVKTLEKYCKWLGQAINRSKSDEDAKSVAPGNFERYWGIYRYDGQPKYAIDVSGQSQNKFLVPAQNMEYLPNKWCVFNPNAKDLSKLANDINFACTFTDCTTLGYGSSCSNLDANENALYAFNMYFQI